MSELKAGRELNRLVAKKVMGLHVQFSNALGGDWTGTSIEEGYSRVRLYSEDIQAAMQVVEKMRGEGHDWLLDLDCKRGWIVTVSGKGYGVADQESESLAECICLAALKAVESLEVKNETLTY